MATPGVAPKLEAISTDAARLGRSVFHRLHVSRVQGPAILLVLCCLFCWKLTLSREFTWIDDSDIVRMDLPRLQFQRHAWQNFEFPLWDPHLWCGQPFLGEIVGAAFPLNWPFFLLPNNESGHIPYVQLNWFFVFTHFMGALGLYCLCRELECSRTASVLGGLAYSFSGAFGMARWPEITGGLVMAPFVIQVFVRALWRTRLYSTAAAGGFLLGLAWLSGHHEVPIYLCVTTAAIGFYAMATNTSRLHLAKLLGIFFGIGILTSGFQTVPGYEYAKLAVRWVGLDKPVGWNDVVPYRIDVQQSFAPSSLIAMIVPFGASHSDIFIGIGLLTLAIIAVFMLWEQRWIRIFACMSIGGLLLSSAGFNVVHGILYSLVPLFSKARNPIRFLFLFQLGVAVLAAFGLDALSNSTQSAIVRNAYRTLAIFAALVFTVVFCGNALQKPLLLDAFYFAALLAGLLAWILYARNANRISGRAVSIVLTTLILVDLANLSTAIFLERNPQGRASFLPRLGAYEDATAFLRKLPKPIRVDAQATEGFNIGDWDQIDTLVGYGAGVTERLYSIDWGPTPIENVLAVNYSMSKDPARPDQVLVYKSNNGTNIYRNLNALPRTWIVHSAETARSAKEAKARLLDPKFNPREVALVEGRAPQMDSCSGDEAQLLGGSINSVVISATTACKGMLILADTYYPGWSATVDGRSVDIQPVYHVVRGVMLDAGKHRVEFHYRPGSAMLGAGMSVMGLLLTIGLWWRDRCANSPA